MNTIQFKLFAHSRLYLNNHTPDDFIPENDTRNFSVESIEELADLYNYQWMKREKLKSEGKGYFKTYIVQYLILLLQKFV